MTDNVAGRLETDLLGHREIPEQCWFGVHTQRAVENFVLSGRPIGSVPALVRAMVEVKKAAALANAELGVLDPRVASAITAACDRVATAPEHWADQFPIDLIQGGAGTSTNMNVNEVIANVALDELGEPKGTYTVVNPMDDVNHSQSTNDVYPTGLRIAAYRALAVLEHHVTDLARSLRQRGEDFADVLKMGRTQLQDALPMTLGQEFTGYAVTLEEEVGRLREARDHLLEVNLGATAIGTGVNTPPGYRRAVVRHLGEVTGLPIRSAAHLIEATSDTGDFVLAHSALKRVAIKLSKTSNDLRLLSSGPRAGLHEISLPQVQAGSSIMPGKINPVIPEAVSQVAFKVFGNDVTVTFASEAGQLELNAMEPVIAQSLFESIEWLQHACDMLRTKCIDGIVAHADTARQHVLRSVSTVTHLNDLIGHAAGDRVSARCLETGQDVRTVVLELGLATAEQVDAALAPESMLAGPDDRPPPARQQPAGEAGTPEGPRAAVRPRKILDAPAAADQPVT